MTNYPKDEESSFKNEKIMSISFFEEILEFTRIRQVYKGKVERCNFQNAAQCKTCQGDNTCNELNHLLPYILSSCRYVDDITASIDKNFECQEVMDYVSKILSIYQLFPKSGTEMDKTQNPSVF